MEQKNKEGKLEDINSESPISEIESVCMNCQEKGTTRLLMTKIPFFKEIIISSFCCDHCGYKNTEVEPAESLAPQGIHFELSVKTEKDLNRKVIKTNFATIKVPCCDLEIPTSTQKGKLSTIEGFINTAKESMKTSLEDGYFAEMGNDYIAGVKRVIENLTDTLEGKKFPFDFILDDPSGNSFIENPYAPQTDPYIKVSFYDRTKEMAESMGYSFENQVLENKGSDTAENKEEKDKNLNSISESKIDENKKKDEHMKMSYYNKKKDFTVYKSSSEISKNIIDFTEGIDNENSDVDRKLFAFDCDCACCGAHGKLRSCVCSIPYFKEIIISCFKCEQCGYKSTDVKGGGGISEKGTKLTLKVENKEDYNRDVFKSETSKVIIPEIGFESSLGSMGSMFTTVEGVLCKIIDDLENNTFGVGDSRENDDFKNFINKVKDIHENNKKFTLIIDDPNSNSFIFPLGEYENDKGILKEEYERTFEQNEELGINDMKVDNYEE